MCSIIGSFSKDKIKELVTLNQHRGNFSYSISLIDVKTNKVVEQIKEFEEFSTEMLGKCYEADGIYYLCHVQAPTGGLVREFNRIHPTQHGESFMWHNGIIKPRSIKDLQKHLDTDVNFDTQLLHESFQSYSLSDIEGLFACAYLDKNGLLLFRSKHAKLYIDEDLNISSEQFDGSKCINYDTVYKVNFSDFLEEVGAFTTKRFNIVIEGEL